MSTFLIMQNRVLDATLRGGVGNRDQIKEDINEAIREVDAQLRPQIKVSTETLVQNQGDYSISGDFGITDLMGVRGVTYFPINNPQFSPPLAPATPAEIWEMRETFTYSTYVNLYAFDGLDMLMLHPTTQSVGDTIKLYYVPRPAELINNSDVPTGLPPEWHDLYVSAATYRAMRQTSPEYAQLYHGEYQARLGEYRKWRNRREGARPRVARVGSTFRRVVPHDPSTDLR